jgi:hypothetical protein
MWRMLVWRGGIPLGDVRGCGPTFPDMSDWCGNGCLDGDNRWSSHFFPRYNNKTLLLYNCGVIYARADQAQPPIYIALFLKRH